MRKILFTSFPLFNRTQEQQADELLAILPWGLRRFDGLIICAATVHEHYAAARHRMIQRAIDIAVHNGIEMDNIYFGRRVFNTHADESTTPYDSFLTWMRAIALARGEASALGCRSFLYVEPHGKQITESVKAGFSIDKLNSLRDLIRAARGICGGGVDLVYPGGGRFDGDTPGVGGWHYSWAFRECAEGRHWANHGTYRVVDPSSHSPVVPPGYDAAITHWGSWVSCEPDAEASGDPPTKPLSVRDWLDFDESKLPPTVHTRWCYISQSFMAETLWQLGKESA